MAKQLETLELRPTFHLPRSPYVAIPLLSKKALEYVTSTDVFQTYHIDLCSFKYYNTDRDGMLDILSHEDIIASLLRFPMHRLFKVTLRENDPRYSELWWTKQVALRCPEELRSAVSVQVDFSNPSTCMLLYLLEDD